MPLVILSKESKYDLKGAIEEFDEAAREWGWQSDQGVGPDVDKAEARYTAAKAHLCKLLGIE